MKYENIKTQIWAMELLNPLTLEQKSTLHNQNKHNQAHIP